MEVTTRYTIDDLLAVANTRHGAAAHPNPRDPLMQHDHLREPDDARQFLEERGIDVPPPAPSRRDLSALADIRDAVDRIAVDQVSDASAAIAGLLPAGSFRLDAAGRLEPMASGWPALTDGLLLPLLDLVRLRDRLERCANPDCGWLFVDRSRNRSRQWCEMGACGNRAKASRFRERHGRRRPTRSSDGGATSSPDPMRA